MSCWQLRKFRIVLLSLIAILPVITGCGFGLFSSDSTGSATGVPVSAAGGPTGVISGSSADKVMVHGVVADGAVRGAAVQAFADPSCTVTLSSGQATTDTTGAFTLAVPASGVTSSQSVFIRTTGGIDIDTGAPPPPMTGVCSRPTTATAIVAVTPLSSVVVQTMRADPTADPDQARARVAAVFGLGDDFVLNPPQIASTSSLAAANKVLVQLGRTMDGGPPADQVAAAISRMASGIATGTVDVAGLGAVLNATIPTGGDGPVLVIHAPPALHLRTLDIGTVSMDLTTRPISASGSDDLPAVLGDPDVTIAGAIMPSMGVSLQGQTDVPAGSRLSGGLEVSLSASGDQRVLSVSIQPFQITLHADGSAASLDLEDATQLIVGGVDAAGRPVADTRIERLGTTAPGIFTGSLATSTTGGSSTGAAGASTVQLVLNPSAILDALHWSASSDAGGHPLGLLRAAGSFDLSLTFLGQLVLNQSGRVSRIVVHRLIRVVDTTGGTGGQGGNTNTNTSADANANANGNANANANTNANGNMNANANATGTANTNADVNANGNGNGNGNGNANSNGNTNANASANTNTNAPANSSTGNTPTSTGAGGGTTSTGGSAPTTGVIGGITTGGSVTAGGSTTGTGTGGGSVGAGSTGTTTATAPSGSSSSGGSGSTTGAALTVQGQVYDGPVAGATVHVFLDSACTMPLTSSPVITRDDGSFQIAIGTVPPGTTTFFFRSDGGSDIATEPVGSLYGVLTTTATTEVSVITPVSSLIVQAVQADPSLDPGGVQTQVANMFGVPDLFAQNSARVTEDGNLALVTHVLVKAAERADPQHRRSRGDRLADLLSRLASGLSTGTLPIDEMQAAFDALDPDERHGQTVTVRSPPTLHVKSVCVGSVCAALNARPIASGGVPTISLDAAHATTFALPDSGPPSTPATATALPDVSVVVAPDPSGPSRFEGSLEISLRSHGVTPQWLTVRLGPVTIAAPTPQTTPVVEATDRAALELRGTDPSGQPLRTILIPHLGSNAPGVGRDTTTGVSAPELRLVFSPAALVRAMQLCTTPEVRHNADLFLTPGVFDLAIRFVGTPVSGDGGRVGEILIQGLNLDAPQSGVAGPQGPGGGGESVGGTGPTTPTTGFPHPGGPSVGGTGPSTFTTGFPYPGGPSVGGTGPTTFTTGFPYPGGPSVGGAGPTTPTTGFRYPGGPSVGGTGPTTFTTGFPYPGSPSVGGTGPTTFTTGFPHPGAFGTGSSILTTSGPIIVRGQVYDGPVVGASVQVYLDPACTMPLTTSPVVTVAGGLFQTQVNAVPPGTSALFFRSIGGTDASTEPVGSLYGVLNTSATSAVVAITPVSSLAVQAMHTDPTLDLDELHTQAEGAFEFDSSADSSADLNTVPVDENGEIALLARLLVKAADRADPAHLRSRGDRLADLLSRLASGLSTGTLPVNELQAAVNALDPSELFGRSITVRQPPSLHVVSVAVGSVSAALSTTPIARDGVPTIALGATATSTPTTAAGSPFTVATTSPVFPDISMVVSPGTTGVSSFSGTVELSLVKHDSIPQVLTVRLGPVTIAAPTPQTTPTLQPVNGVQLQVQGADSMGLSLPAIVISDPGHNAPGVGRATSDGVSAPGLRLVISPSALVSALQSSTTTGANHAADLFLESGVFDLSIRFAGVPLAGDRGRVGEIKILGLERIVPGGGPQDLGSAGSSPSSTSPTTSTTR